MVNNIVNLGLQYALVLFHLAILAGSADAKPQSWPRLIAKSESAICEDASLIAKAMFKSDNFYLYAPPPDLESLQSSFVMRPSSVDISGGGRGSLNIDAQVLRPISRADLSSAGAYFYWQDKAQQGFRYAIDAAPVGWRGDIYAVYSLPESMKPEDFAAAMSEQRSEPEPEFSSWRPPLMLKRKNSEIVWGIFVGQNFNPLARWKVFSLGPSGSAEDCSIAFAPKVKNSYLEVLPKDVRKLAELLDATLGRGENEGTLNPTARLRLNAQWAWANVAMRPWAVQSKDPGNTREQVDAGLLAWSKATVSYSEHYKKIADQYPKAEKALASYYSSHFDKSSSEAFTLAKTVLDYAYRSYFMFGVPY